MRSFRCSTPSTYEVADIISTYPHRLFFPPSSQLNDSLSTAIVLFNTMVNPVFLLTTNYFINRFPEFSLF